MPFEKGYIPWNKNKKTGIHPTTSFKKGHIINNGRVPWNKGKFKPEEERKISLSKGIRCSEKYYKWRINVYRRDYFTCQNCKRVGHNLNAHHIKSFRKTLKENNIKTMEEAYNCQELWDIDNGITLCQDCHDLIPKKD